MSGQVRVYRNPTRGNYTVASGEVRYYTNSSTRTYVCKRHYPDADEISLIHAEIAAGGLRKDVAPRHLLSTKRLRALLKKYPLPPPVLPPAPPIPDSDPIWASLGLA